MASASFAVTAPLPRAPPGQRLVRLRYATCPGSDLALEVVRDVDGALDAHGVPRDSWWAVRCKSLPDRTMRLHGGAHSLEQLLRRYGFQDASGCVHHHAVTPEYAPAGAAIRGALTAVPAHLVDATGVPQPFVNSGICWFAALCYIAFGNAAVRRWLASFMPPALARLAERALYDKEAAFAFRARLWFDYHIGDDVEDDPAKDGRNGFLEFATLCAKLGVPMLRYGEKGGRLVPIAPGVTDRRKRAFSLRAPKPGERHLLVLRYQDGDHVRHPIQRRVVRAGVRYRLVGVFLGQRKCGHQIGACFPTDSWRDVSWGDADLHKDGIGPVHVRFEGDEWRDGWWDGMDVITHLTKFGPGHREICNMSFHNPDDASLDHHIIQYRGVGSCSNDVVYISA